MILFLGYLSLGELRFFANHYLRLTFFHKDYLILLQNNYESRPTGGFITGYGEVSATMGFVSNISFHNSYEIDTNTYITPPYPQEELLKNEWYQGYTFRDANWNPDFPSSAETLIDFYQKKFPDKDVDGIIVMNFSMVEDLVKALGNIEIEGEKVNADSLFKTITDTVNDVDRHDETALIERKSILGEMAANLIPKAKWHPFKTKKVIIDALHSKDLFMWFKSTGMQKKVEKKGWANHMDLAENSDFLHVNLANLGSKKADRYLIKEVFHHVNIQKEIPEITTEIMVRYPGSKNIYADDYKGYLRIYIPASATIQSDTLGASVETEEGFKVIGTQLILPAGSKSTIGYTYELPRTLLPLDTYRLRLVTQSGDNKSYTVTVESPGDSAISSDDFDTMENRAIWRSIPESDVDLDLHLGEDSSAPYPIEQVFEDLNTIAIYWNEPIEVSSGGDALNYEIIDTNEINSAVTDEVKVAYAEVVDGSVSKLDVEGMTEQNLERYKIKISNIKDQASNPLEPDPKEITVVQRIVTPPVSEEEPAEPARPE
ncbi:DUF4012 domain-containing protein [Candidatus Peregrinibacteria bacterium]|nr:DUF4012 domain-containing protein [Candidatus Peregrinibacteria bacterium]